MITNVYETADCGLCVSPLGALFPVCQVWSAVWSRSWMAGQGVTFLQVWSTFCSLSWITYQTERDMGMSFHPGGVKCYEPNFGSGFIYWLFVIVNDGTLWVREVTLFGILNFEQLTQSLLRNQAHPSSVTTNNVLVKKWQTLNEIRVGKKRVFWTYSALTLCFVHTHL